MAKKLLKIKLLFLNNFLFTLCLNQACFAQDFPASLRIVTDHHFEGKKFSNEDFSLASAEGAAKHFFPTILLMEHAYAQKESKDLAPYVINITSNGIAVISQIDFSSDELTTRLLSELRSANLSKPIVGFLLDLSQISEFDNYSEVVRLASLFLQPGISALTIDGGQHGTMQVFQTVETQPHFPNTPICVITDSQTAGAPELLADLLSHHGRALIVGEKTKGMPYKYFKTTLSDGRTFAVANAKIKVTSSTEHLSRGVTPDILADKEMSLTVGKDFLRTQAAIQTSILASLQN